MKEYRGEILKAHGERRKKGEEKEEGIGKNDRRDKEGKCEKRN